MIRRALVLSACVLAACASRPRAPAGAPGPVPVVDLHVDLAYAIEHGNARLDDGASEVSARRLEEGHVARLVVPLFVEDASTMGAARARAAYDATFAALDAALARTPIVPAVMLAFEGADGFADDPRAFDAWAARGACLVGLVHARSNALAGSSQDPAAEARARGLTAAGRALAERVVSMGGLLDLAHASDAAQDELLAIARARRAPVVDSHTGMRALAPSARNLDDARARAIAERGGVIGVSLHSGHVSRRPGERASMDDYAAHLEHAVRVAGEEHVAIGSDLAGAITQPEGADGAATWPALAVLLRARGWSEARIAAVLHGNAERVLAWSAAHGCARDVRRR